MKLLFLNYEYPPLGGGAANATWYLLREYAKIPDLEVDLVTSSVDGYKVENLTDNIRIHYLDINKKGNLHFQTEADLLRYSWKAYWYSRKLMKEGKYDLCHAFFGIPCGFIAMCLGLPYIASLRGSDVPFYNPRFVLLDKIVFRTLSRIVWRKAKAVVSLSYDLIDLARKTSKKQEISVIYNGINIEEFHPDSAVLKNESSTNILFVGRLIERKGLNFLLEAFSQLAEKYADTKLLIAGDGPLMDTYKKYAEEKNLSKRILFFGRMEHDQMAKLYQRSHIFVLPSLNEALGNVTQEALAAGLPIITTRTGAAELIEDGISGYVIDKGSSELIREKLEVLLDDENLMKSMSKRSRELAESMSWEKTSDKYNRLYRQIIGS